MNYYIVSVPKVSDNLKTTYHKNLEVYEVQKHNQSFVPKFIHEYKKGKWVTSESVHKNFGIKNNVRVNDNVISSYMRYDGNESFEVFSNLDIAKISKVLMIQKMKSNIKEQLDKMFEKLEKNVPGVDELAKYYKDNHPEYFI